MTHHIRRTGSPAPVRLVSELTARARAEELTQQHIEDAQLEAERLWRASIVAAVRQETPQDHLAAVEKARDVAFSLWCDLTSIDGSSDPTAS